MRIAVSTELDGVADDEVIQTCLDLSQALCELYLRTHPHTPPLYASGVVYRREPRSITARGPEDFATVPLMLRRGWGDCDDLAPWRAAELTLWGYPARATVVRVRNGWHVVVTAPDGSTVDDPSAQLGMYGV